jgi:hypothetical protein
LKPLQEQKTEVLGRLRLGQPILLGPQDHQRLDLDKEWVACESRSNERRVEPSQCCEHPGPRALATSRCVDEGLKHDLRSDKEERL